jgi:putative FmdB family regulatory protein
MPTYEYRCNACGHKFEAFHAMSAEPVKVCPKCRKRKVERLISGGAGFIFKGSGFYITDYRSDSYKKAAEADKTAASAPPAAKADTPSPSKSEPAPAKAESKPAAGGDGPAKSK